MHHTLPRQATSNKNRAMLSRAHVVTGDKTHRLAVKIMSRRMSATTAFDSGNRYFSSAVDSADACSVAIGDSVLATKIGFLIFAELFVFLLPRIIVEIEYHMRVLG